MLGEITSLLTMVPPESNSFWKLSAELPITHWHGWSSAPWDLAFPEQHCAQLTPTATPMLSCGGG